MGTRLGQEACPARALDASGSGGIGAAAADSVSAAPRALRRTAGVALARAVLFGSAAASVQGKEVIGGTVDAASPPGFAQCPERSAMLTQNLLESTMLLCFGVAWPLANLRMMRSKQTEGKGMGFTLIILIGYVAGAAAKWVSAEAGQAIPGVFWLYAINAGSVMMNLALQLYFGQQRWGRVKWPITATT